MIREEIWEMQFVPVLFLVDVVSALLLSLVVEHLYVYRPNADPRLTSHLSICELAAVIMRWVFSALEAWLASSVLT